MLNQTFHTNGYVRKRPFPKPELQGRCIDDKSFPAWIANCAAPTDNPPRIPHIMRGQHILLYSCAELSLSNQRQAGIWQNESSYCRLRLRESWRVILSFCLSNVPFYWLLIVDNTAVHRFWDTKPVQRWCVTQTSSLFCHTSCTGFYGFPARFLPYLLAH